MSGEREQVMAVLMGLFETIVDADGNPLKSISRRIRNPTSVKDTDRPCMFLHEHEDKWEKQAFDLPPVRSMVIYAIVMVAAPTQNAIPNQQMTGFLEAIEALFNAEDDNDIAFRLNGVATGISMDGEAPRVVDDKTGQGFIAIPLKVELYA